MPAQSTSSPLHTERTHLGANAEPPRTASARRPPNAGRNDTRLGEGPEMSQGRGGRSCRTRCHRQETPCPPEVTASSPRGWKEHTRTRNEDMVKANSSGVKAPRTGTEPRLWCVDASKTDQSTAGGRRAAGQSRVVGGAIHAPVPEAQFGIHGESRNRRQTKRHFAGRATAQGRTGGGQRILPPSPLFPPRPPSPKQPGEKRPPAGTKPKQLSSPSPFEEKRVCPGLRPAALPPCPFAWAQNVAPRLPARLCGI